MSPKKVARNSRPNSCLLRYPKFLLSLSWVLYLGLSTWGGSPIAIQAEMAQAGLRPETPQASLATAPEGLARALHPAMQFEPNLGQTDPQVHFMARGVGYTVFLTPTEAVLVLPTSPSQPDTAATAHLHPAGSPHVIQLQVLEANPTPIIRGIHETPTTIHRLKGTDPTQWQTDIPVYEQVRYDAMYPGIDLLYYGNQQQLEYDFIVHPGADPSQIMLGIQGVDQATVDAEGHLRLTVSGGMLRLQKPVLSQTVAGKHTTVAGSFRLLEPNPTDTTAPPIQLAFAVGTYDPTLPLIIDPLVNYATAFGGEGEDKGEAIAVDTAGHGYVVGTTNSFTFPVTADAVQDSAIGTDPDVFVTKFNTATSEILFSTYIGGEGEDRATGVAVDAQGIPYVTGQTTSLTFPTQQPFQATRQGPSDAFVLKLATDGSSLLYSTYLGGSGPDHANSIVVNAQGQAALTGTTTSPDFPLVHAVDTRLGHGEAVPQSDGFLTTLDAQGAALHFSTFLGGAGADIGHSLTLDAQGALYLTGETTDGAGFPMTADAFQATYGGGTTDAFLIKINPVLAGQAALQYASYLGGSGQDVGLDLLVDAHQQAFITGWTTGQGQAPTVAVATPSPAPAPNAPVSAWGRRSGPPAGGSSARGFRGGMRGVGPPPPAPPPAPAPVSQVSPSAPLPGFPVTPNAYDATFNGEQDAFIAQVHMGASGPTALAYATYVGGRHADTGIAIGVDSLGRVCIAGTTASADYPVKNALANHGTFHGGTDGFVTKFRADPTTLLFSSFLGGSGQETVTGMGVDAGNNAYLTGQTRSTDFPLLTALDTTPLTGEPQAFVVKVQDPVTLRLNFIGPLSPAPRVGALSTFGLEWTNLGPDEATGVELELDFTSISPDILRYVSLANTGGPSPINLGSCTGSADSGPGGTLTCNVSNLPAPDSIEEFSTATVTVEALVAGSFDTPYDAELTANELDAATGGPSVATADIGNFTISPALVDLTVDFQGDGTGSVVATPGPSSSTATFTSDTTLPYDSGTSVSLAATPTGPIGNLSIFSGWTGCDSVSVNTCIVTMNASRTVIPLFEPGQSTLAVTKSGTGSGTVTGPGINCGSDCTESVNIGTGITLTASPSGGSTFTGWTVTISGSPTGECPGTGTCSIDMDADRTVTANFNTVQRTLTVTKTGSGSGTVTGTGINCGSDCTHSANNGTQITLTAAASGGSTFTGWTVSGSPETDCPGTGTCTVPLDTNRTATANFNTVQRTLTVTKTGSGSGTVTGTGINCGSDCTESVNIGTGITLTASPSAGSTFTGWTVTISGSPTGECPGTDACSIDMDDDRTVTANFNSLQRTLTVTKTGSGSGTVTGTGINCGSDCTHSANNGTQITLTAAASGGSTFTGWTVTGSPTASCPGTGTCTVPLDTNRTATANFNSVQRTLTVTKTGSGSGTVTGTGINCGSDCTHSANNGTQITLTAAASGGSTFTGWTVTGSPTASCPGTGTCTVPLDTNRTATANFNSVQRTLTVTKTGSGSGTVTGTGINCGSDCTHSANNGTQITLTAAASGGSTFTGWTVTGSPTASCPGTGTCTVPLDTNRTATANFNSVQRTLTVTKTGSGTVTSPGFPNFINCGSDCTGTTQNGSNFDLRARPAAGFTFSNWTGCDSASGNQCTGVLNADRTVTANFTQSNQAPSVEAGPNQSITLPAGATLNGTVTDDGLPTPPALTTTWTQVGGPAGSVTFANAAAVDTTATFSAPGTYALRLTADDGPLSTADDVTITVSAANTAPTVSAGPNQSITLPAGATLNGTVTDDGLPTPPALTTTWTQVGGPAGSVTFANAAAVDTTATFSAPGTYALRLTADDGPLSTADDVTITVSAANTAPTVSAGPNQSITLPAGATLNGTVTDDGLPTPPALTTTWTQVGGPAGSVTFANAAAVDTTATFSAPGTYALRLTADDGPLSTADDVTITVSAANTAPTVSAGPNQSITLPAGATLNGTVTDDGLPTPPALTTTWTQVGGPAGSVTFANAAAVDTTATFSAPGTYALRLTADDGPLSTADDVTITVSAANTAPTVSAGPNQSITLPAGATLNGTVTDDGLPTPPALTTTWTQVGGPAGSVTFANAAAVDTAATFSAPGTYALRLTADDGPLSTADDVTITVAPIRRTLTVTRTGSGSGTVTGPGLSCGTDCTDIVNDGTQIALTAAPDPSFFFTGWAVSGSPTATCPGTGTCTVPMNTNRTVTATFAANQPPVVEAGPPQVINLSAGVSLPVDVTLVGTITDDGLPPPASLTSLWRLVTGPAVIPDIINNAMPTVSFPAIGSYTLELSANDGALPSVDTVIITINNPSATQVLIPSVVGQPEAVANTALTTAGLTPGTITQELNALVPSGSVIRQTPLGGELGNPGTPVNLVISSGTELLITMVADGPDATPGDGTCETSPGNGTCSLRAAIQEANAFPGQQTITLPPDTYTLMLAGANEDAAATGDLDITDDLIIESSTGNATQVIISGNTFDRVFDLPPGSSPNVTLRGLTIQDGMIEGSTGGGLRNAQGTLTVENSVITTNTTNGSGGGISHLGGTLTLRNTEVSNNTSQGLGGGLQAQDGTVTINGNTRFTNNTANFGGGLSTGGADVTLTNVRIEDNTAVGGGGGIYKFLSPGDLLPTIQAPRVALSNTTVRNNTINDCEGYFVNIGNNTFGTTAGCTLLTP